MSLELWDSDKQAWECVDDAQKVALAVQWGYHLCNSPELVNVRLKLLNVVSDHAENAVLSGLSLKEPHYHRWWELYRNCADQPRFGLPVVRKGVLEKISTELNIDVDSFHQLMHQVCNVKHYLHFAGIHGKASESENAVPVVENNTKRKRKESKPFSHHELRILEQARRERRTPRLRINALAKSMQRPEHSVQIQLAKMHKIERDADMAVAEGVRLTPGPDTDLWALQLHRLYLVYPGSMVRFQVVAEQFGQSVAQLKLRIKCIGAVKKYLCVSGVHDEEETLPTRNCLTMPVSDTTTTTNSMLSASNTTTDDNNIPAISNTVTTTSGDIICGATLDFEDLVTLDSSHSNLSLPPNLQWDVTSELLGTISERSDRDVGGDRSNCDSGCSGSSGDSGGGDIGSDSGSICSFSDDEDIITTNSTTYVNSTGISALHNLVPAHTTHFATHTISTSTSTAHTTPTTSTVRVRAVRAVRTEAQIRAERAIRSMSYAWNNGCGNDIYKKEFSTTSTASRSRCRNSGNNEPMAVALALPPARQRRPKLQSAVISTTVTTTDTTAATTPAPLTTQLASLPSTLITHRLLPPGALRTFTLPPLPLSSTTDTPYLPSPTGTLVDSDTSEPNFPSAHHTQSTPPQHQSQHQPQQLSPLHSQSRSDGSSISTTITVPDDSSAQPQTPTQIEVAVLRRSSRLVTPNPTTTDGVTETGITANTTTANTTTTTTNTANINYTTITTNTTNTTTGVRHSANSTTSTTSAAEKSTDEVHVCSSPPAPEPASNSVPTSATTTAGADSNTSHTPHTLTATAAATAAATMLRRSPRLVAAPLSPIGTTTSIGNPTTTTCPVITTGHVHSPPARPSTNTNQRTAKRTKQSKHTPYTTTPALNNYNNAQPTPLLRPAPAPPIVPPIAVVPPAVPLLSTLPAIPVIPLVPSAPLVPARAVPDTFDPPHSPTNSSTHSTCSTHSTYSTHSTHSSINSKHTELPLHLPAPATTPPPQPPPPTLRTLPTLHTGPFSAAEDSVIWHTWHFQLPRTVPEIKQFNHTCAALLHRNVNQSHIIYQRVQTLSQLECDVTEFVAQGATLLPSPVTELWHQYTLMTQVESNSKYGRLQNSQAVRLLQATLHPGYDVGSVLKEVQMVKGFLRLCGIHE